MKIQNNFTKGTINKDVDERLVAPNELIDAENFLVSTTEGSNAGVGKNVPGNVKKTNYNIPGAITIGVGENESKNRIFNCIKGTNHDYIIEYNVDLDISTIVLQSTTGGVLNFKEGERITNVDVISSGDINDDLLAISGDTNPPRLFNIEKAKTYGIDGFTEDEISVMKPSPIFAPTINLTTSVDGVENNFIKEKFICFAYRYKYSDGFYSAPSSWSRVAFEPNRFSLDYQTYENNGMINLSNAVDVFFNTGSRDVVEVELLFRESNNETIFVIDSFKKDELSWADNSVQSFQLSKSKIFKVLPNDQFFRNYDNVPLMAVAQTLIGNRLAYANYTEGYDIDTEIDFDVDIVSEEPYLENLNATLSNYTDIVDYSNEVDFEEGVEDGGTSPVDQMDFATNTISIDLTGSPDYALFNIVVTPKSEYSAVVYDVFVMEGTTIQLSWTGLTGNNTLNNSISSNKNVKIYVTSSEGLIYDLKLNYNLVEISQPDVSRYDYFAYDQLSFPKSTGFGATKVGDTIIDTIITFDFVGFEFVAGNQIRINFELQSSLVYSVKPSVTFFYNLTSNYSDLDDFITNSSFKEILENAFSENFKNTEISNEGSLVSYQGFLLGNIGSVLTIRTPKVVYNVNELSGVTEDKNEFYLTKEAELLSVTNSSFASLHSNRDVEVCMFYLDSKGRKTTSLVCPTNTAYIPAENSSTVNKLKVSVNHTPPTFAKYYKFGVKQVKKAYETIYGNQVYKDGVFRWVKLVGENKNKVKEGDVLIVKSDYSGVLDTVQRVKVLEISTQAKDFIEGNVTASGKDLIEESGLYMKFKQGNFDVNVDQDSFRSFEGFEGRRYASRSFVYTEPLFGEYDGTTFIPLEVKTGTQIRFEVTITRKGDNGFSFPLEITTYAQEDYASVKDWWDAEISTLGTWITYANDHLKDFEWVIDSSFGTKFGVKSNRDGTSSRDVYTRVVFDINFSGGTLVFETEPLEVLETSFFETPETYTITSGTHEFVEHLLNDTFDCFAFGNGVESFKIKDSFNSKSFSIDSNPSLVLEEGYKRIHRFADITYSGIFNSNSNVNKLNEFNASNANYKEDIEKSFGSIMKIKGQDTDLDVFQEDKVSKVYYGKDILFNADGTSNLSRIEDVLGQQVTSKGEYGISFHPESHDEYGFNSYLTDTKRGVVLKNNHNNGLFEISFQGMRNYFKKLFRDNKINHIKGQYDQFHDYFLLNIQYNDTEYVTWVYSDKDNGWLGRLTMNPEDMIRINNHLLAFKNGEVYLCNQQSNYNTFFDIETPSTFSFNFSQNPSDRKNFKNISIEGSVPTEIVLKTDNDNGYIHKEDFEKKENVYYAYVRNSNETIDTALLSCQGVGQANINGLTLEFDFDLDVAISVGDKIVNQNLELVGTIISKTTRTLGMDTVNNISNNDFVLVSKPQSIEQQSLLGYYMQVDCEFSSTEAQEIFAINSEVSKSFE